MNTELKNLLRVRQQLLIELDRIDQCIDVIRQSMESQCKHQWERDVTTAHDDLIKWECAKCGSRK